MTTATIRVGVFGAAGRVGREVVKAVSESADMKVVAAFDRVAQKELPPFPVAVAYFTSLKDGLAAEQPDVIIDFTNAEASMAMAPQALAAGSNLVIGSTGFTDGQLAMLDRLCKEHRRAALVAPNFTIGAVVLTKLANIAARFFEYVDVAEEHHEKKIDAPSGTALAIAKAIHEGRREGGFVRQMPTREPLPGTRGGDYHGISIHSTRMPGRMAHHQVTFGAPGQTLVLRHDTLDRECYMPGVLLAVRKIQSMSGLTVGLDKILDW